MISGGPIGGGGVNNMMANRGRGRGGFFRGRGGFYGGSTVGIGAASPPLNQPYDFAARNTTQPTAAAASVTGEEDYNEDYDGEGKMGPHHIVSSHHLCLLFPPPTPSFNTNKGMK
jgi:hypothetical protein